MSKFVALLIVAIFTISGCAPLSSNNDIASNLKQLSKNIEEINETLKIQKPPEKISVNLTQQSADKAYLDATIKTWENLDKNLKDSLETLGKTAGAAAGQALIVKAEQTRTELETSIDKAKKLTLELSGSLPSDCANLKPAVYNLGQSSIVVFDKTNRSGARIAIDGRDMYPECVNFHMTITGDVPLRNACSINTPPAPGSTLARDWIDSQGTDISADREDCHIENPKHDSPDIANLVLKPAYLARLKTRDRITVQVSISEKTSSSSDCKNNATKCRSIAYATRSFTMYELEDFRTKLKASRVDIQDINAFPLTKNETTDLFGPVVSDLYYAVRLSVSNQSGAAKVINTGMIRAEGRAIVEPDKNTEEPIFTVPVTVVPQSLQHVYSIVDGTEPDQKRAKFFRGLEFTGALGTAIKALGTVTRATANLGLFTGVAIPQATKLWPDAVPNYRKNLVDYAMPDLLKVGANSQTGHKYLFFSKRDIETIISDPRMYLPVRQDCTRDITLPDTHCEKKRLKDAAPSSRVISLAFDHLDIRFDNVTNVEVDTAKADLLRLIVDLPKYLDGDYKNSLDNNNKFLATASLGSYKASFDKVWPLDADGKPLDADGNKVFYTKLNDIVKAIEGSANCPSVTNALNILQNSKKYGMATLELDRKQLNTLTSAYSKGEDISLYSKDLSSLATDLDGSKRILGLSASIRNDFDALRKLTERQYTKEQTNSELISPMQKLLGTINAALGSLQELDSVK